MTQHDDAIGLRHMLDHAREAAALVQNTTRDDLHANRVLSLALVRLLEIVGGAATRISEALRARNPHDRLEADHQPAESIDSLPRRVDLDILWQVLHEDIPHLVSDLERLISPEAKA